MIQTSKDILFLVLGFSILLVSFFFALLLYYLIKMASGLSQSVKSIEKITNRAEEITKSLKEKVVNFTFMPLVAEAMKATIDFLREKKKKGKRVEEKEEKE
jgi:cell shape-determining protein MreC